MSTSTHPIIVLSDSCIEDAFSSTNTPDYTPASPDYFPASPGNTFSDPSKDLSKDLLASLAISPFDMYVYCKYHKKRAKTGQKWTRERKEYTRDGKVSTMVNKSQQRSTRLQRSGIATLAIRVHHSHPKATNRALMIGRNKGSRSKAMGAS
ncbi:hypothetical protein Tco_0272209 [Tanacetum coccineum]